MKRYKMEIENLKFDENGLIPAIIQDAETRTVLMLGYMNREALTLTLTNGKVWKREGCIRKCNKRMVQKEKIKGGRIMKITNKKKFIVRILELITIIATIILTIVSIKYANRIRGYKAFGGEYLVPVFGLIIVLVLERFLDEDQN